MENINHVKSYFWIKIFFIPITSIFCFFYTIYIFILNKKYISSKSEIATISRYKKTSFWFKQLFFFQNINFSFIDESKIIKKPTLFIVDSKDVKWYYLYIFAFLLKDKEAPLATFFLSKNQNLFISNFLYLIDVFHNPEDIEFFQKNQKSIICFWNKNIENNDIKNLILKNHFTIIKINLINKKNFFNRKVIFSFMDKLNPINFVNLKNQTKWLKIITFLKKK